MAWLVLVMFRVKTQAFSCRCLFFPSPCRLKGIKSFVFWAFEIIGWHNFSPVRSPLRVSLDVCGSWRMPWSCLAWPEACIERIFGCWKRRSPVTSNPRLLSRRLAGLALVSCLCFALSLAWSVRFFYLPILSKILWYFVYNIQNTLHKLQNI